MISLGVMTQGNIMSLALFCGEYAFNFQAPNYSPGVQLPVTQGLLSLWTAIKNWIALLKELLSSCKKECKLKPCEIKYAGRSKILDIASKSGIQKEKYHGEKNKK